METILDTIIARLRAGERLADRDVLRLIDERNRENARAARLRPDKPRPLMKRALLPFYINVKRDDPARWAAWRLTEAEEAALVELLRVKPRRSASGVATVTVLTKPWPCSGACLYCPQDIRMPKSYLANEPACRRAEGLAFDPYLQVASRLEHLRLMGHGTRRIELIIAGGTWQDYPADYRRWFVRELLRAANDADDAAADGFAARLARYDRAGIARDRAALARETADVQATINRGDATYNEAFWRLYGPGTPWEALAAEQTASWDELAEAWAANRSATARVCGLAIETRPELIDDAAIDELRRLGVTRVQLGLQSLDAGILETNGRGHPPAVLADAFRRLRDGGFVIHGHYMLNLPGSTPDLDREGFRRLIEDPAYRPDEVKLYPCVLVESAPLNRLRAAYRWEPYPEEDLIALMAELLALAPPWLRISRMVRDISAEDILAGSKRANARQLVEARAAADGRPIAELRTREIATDDVSARTWTLVERRYETSSGTECFLSWEDDDARVRAYGRVTLGPHPSIREIRELGSDAAAASELGPWGQALHDRANSLIRPPVVEEPKNHRPPI